MKGGIIHHIIRNGVPFGKFFFTMANGHDSKYFDTEEEAYARLQQSFAKLKARQFRPSRETKFSKLILLTGIQLKNIPLYEMLDLIVYDPNGIANPTETTLLIRYYDKEIARAESENQADKWGMVYYDTSYQLNIMPFKNLKNIMTWYLWKTDNYYPAKRYEHRYITGKGTKAFWKRGRSMCIVHFKAVLGRLLWEGKISKETCKKVISREWTYEQMPLHERQALWELLLKKRWIRE